MRGGGTVSDRRHGTGTAPSAARAGAPDASRPVDLAADQGEDPGLGAAGLTVLGTGEGCCVAVYPDVAAAWAAALGTEPLLLAVHVAGERAVHDAFTASVAGAVEPDGSVRLSRALRYTVAAADGRPLLQRVTLV